MNGETENECFENQLRSCDMTRFKRLEVGDVIPLDKERRHDFLFVTDWFALVPLFVSRKSTLSPTPTLKNFFPSPEEPFSVGNCIEERLSSFHTNLASWIDEYKRQERSSGCVFQICLNDQNEVRDCGKEFRTASSWLKCALSLFKHTQDEVTFKYKNVFEELVLKVLKRSFTCRLRNDVASACFVNDLLQEHCLSQKAAFSFCAALYRLNRPKDRSSVSQLSTIIRLLSASVHGLHERSPYPEVLEVALTFLNDIPCQSAESAWRFLDVFGSAWNALKRYGAKQDALEEQLIDALLESQNIQVITTKIPKIKACAIRLRQHSTIFIDESISSELRSFTLLHEMAHLQLLHSGLPASFFSEAGLLPHEISRCEQEEREADFFANVVLGLLRKSTDLNERSSFPNRYSKLAYKNAKNTQRAFEDLTHGPGQKPLAESHIDKMLHDRSCPKRKPTNLNG